MPNFHSPTNLFSQIQNPPPQTLGSECKKSDSSQFFDIIIQDAMSDSSFVDSQNPEAKRLHDKASMLAASALATSTKTNYGKAWAWFLDFCDKIGYNPMKASGQDIATWIVFRSEQTSSQNMLEADLKVVKCFRQTANKPILDFSIADSVLKGLLKKKKLSHCFARVWNQKWSRD